MTIDESLPNYRSNIRNQYTLEEVLEVGVAPDEDKYLTTRSVERRIQAGNAAGCLVCGITLKFSAREKNNQIISNVYDLDDNWFATVHTHPECYAEIGQPFGEPSAEQPKYTG